MNNRRKAMMTAVILYAALVCMVATGCSGSSVRNTGSDDGYNDEPDMDISSDLSLQDDTCAISGCDKRRADGSIYCDGHTCTKTGCNSKKAPDSDYCYSHTPSSTNSGSSSSPQYSNNSSGSGSKKNQSSSGTTKRYDPYDADDYADGDDFAEEWAEEFGDGDYDDGYDEAYDYWEEEME